MASEHCSSILRTAAEVREWRGALRHEIAAPPIAFDFRTISAAENRRLTDLAERYRRACGCEAGGIGGMLAVVLSAILWIVPASRPDLTLANVAVTAGAIISTSVLARLAALGWARASLIRLAGTIEQLTLKEGFNGTSL